MCEIGLSTHRRNIDEDLFRKYYEAEISCMEVSVNFDILKNLDVEMIRSYAEKYNINLWSFHLPFYPFEFIDISRKSLQRNSIYLLCNLINQWSSVGIDKFVIHPSGEPITDDERAARLECAKESLVELAEFARHKGAYIAVENLPRTCLGKDSREILHLTEGHENLRVCFDTNHLLQERHIDFIHNVGKKIITTHISDYDFTDEKHWMPGEGKIQWNSLLRELVAAGYSGIWMYEADGPTDFAEYRKNAESCLFL